MQSSSNLGVKQTFIIDLEADVPTGAGITSPGTKPTDTVDPKTALSHGHTLLATTGLGRFSDADAHTATEQWRAKTDTLALDFWNNTTTASSN